MKNKIKLIILLVSLGVAVFLNLNAQPVQDRSAEQTNASPPAGQTNQPDARMMQHMQEMDAMAGSMKSMADMCRMMMEKEMRNAPLKMGAIIGVGSLFFIALILFIVLEIQWIRFWSVHIKTERLKLAGGRSS